MKRYRMDMIYQVEDPDGHWVRYADVLKIRDKAFGEGREYEALSEGRKSTQSEPPVECNCVAKSEGFSEACIRASVVSEDFVTDSISWICPSHGYKRL